MKQKTYDTLSPRLHARISGYATLAAAALAGPALAPSANATVVTSGPVNISVPNTIDGIYINFVTGATGTSAAAVSGWDFDPYAGSGELLFYFGGDAGSLSGGVAATADGPYLVLTSGATIGPASTFSQDANGLNDETAAFDAGVNGYLGVEFTNEATGALDYGYVHFQTTGTTGFPATILDYAYDNTGAAITIPAAVPEPSTTTALGLGALALGACGLRQWRRRKAA